MQKIKKILNQVVSRILGLVVIGIGILIERKFSPNVFNGAEMLMMCVFIPIGVLLIWYPCDKLISLIKEKIHEEIQELTRPFKWEEEEYEDFEEPFDHNIKVEEDDYEDEDDYKIVIEFLDEDD